MLERIAIEFRRIDGWRDDENVTNINREEGYGSQPMITF